MNGAGGGGAAVATTASMLGNVACALQAPQYSIIFLIQQSIDCFGNTYTLAWVCVTRAQWISVNEQWFIQRYQSKENQIAMMWVLKSILVLQIRGALRVSYSPSTLSSIHLAMCALVVRCLVSSVFLSLTLSVAHCFVWHRRKTVDAPAPIAHFIRWSHFFIATTSSHCSGCMSQTVDRCLFDCTMLGTSAWVLGGTING